MEVRKEKEKGKSEGGESERAVSGEVSNGNPLKDHTESNHERQQGRGKEKKGGGGKRKG